MTDPRFFRRYLDILSEQPTPTTVNVGDTTSVTADKASNSVTAKTDIGGTNIAATRNLGTGDLASASVSTNVGGADIKATQDFSTAKTGAGQVSVDAPVAPGTTVGGTYTQAGYKGQMTPTNQVRMSYKDTAGALGKPGQTHNVAYTQGAMLGGASGPNVGKNVATTYTKS
jgi:hypothetical protein